MPKYLCLPEADRTYMMTCESKLPPRSVGPPQVLFQPDDICGSSQKSHPQSLCPNTVVVGWQALSFVTTKTRPPGFRETQLIKLKGQNPFPGRTHELGPSRSGMVHAGTQPCTFYLFTAGGCTLPTRALTAAWRYLSGLPFRSLTIKHRTLLLLRKATVVKQVLHQL